MLLTNADIGHNWQTWNKIHGHRTRMYAKTAINHILWNSIGKPNQHGWIYLKMGAYVRSWWNDDFWWSSEYLLWISRHLFYEEFKWLLINIFTKTTNIYRPLPDTMDTILSPIKSVVRSFYMTCLCKEWIKFNHWIIDYAELLGGMVNYHEMKKDKSIFIWLKHLKF